MAQKTDPLVRELRARKGGLARWSKEDPKTAMEKVRAAKPEAQRRRVVAEAAERGEALTDREIDRRVELRQREHMLGMTLKAKKKREEVKRARAEVLRDAEQRGERLTESEVVRRAETLLGSS